MNLRIRLFFETEMEFDGHNEIDNLGVEYTNDETIQNFKCLMFF